MRNDLVSWQWQGYPTFHQRPLTLWLHVLAVPTFVVATLSAVASAATLHFVGAGIAVGVMALAFVAQAFAHGREPNPAIPFEGVSDLVTRIFLEQFFTFPRFVLSGGWARALRAHSESARSSAR